MLLEGKSVFITGGGRGIGRGIALTFAQNGANVAVSDIDADAADKTAQDIRSFGVNGLALRSDVSVFNSINAAIREAYEKLGCIDVLINNAGINRVITIEEMTEEEWDKVFNVNMKGVFLCTKAVIPYMKKNGSGNIINMASPAGKTGGAKVTCSHYAASKAGVICFTKSSARELAKYNIRVNALAPGLITTEMTDDFSAEERKKLADIIPMVRPGTVEDVSKAAVFLASDLSSYVTGQIIPVNGGMWMDY